MAADAGDKGGQRGWNKRRIMDIDLADGQGGRTNLGD